MEDSVPPLQDAAVDLDLLDELLSGPVFDCPELLQTSICPSSGPFISSSLSAVIGASSCSTNPMPFSTVDYQVDGERPIFSMDGMQMEMLDVGQSINLNPLRLTPFSIDRGEKEGDGLSFVPDSTCRIQPKNPIFTVGQRLNHALKNIKESQKDGDVLLQIWVPVIRENRQVLTTCDQPFLLDFNCQRLVNYRSISTRYQFLADEDSHEAVGLPGRVFLGKLPEWTPDVRYFSSHEYPRVIAAQLYDVRGTIALPFFEKDNRSCLGVIELVMTKQKANCSSDIESICSALQAVDLRSSEVMSIPCLKMPGDSYQVALPEIHMVLRAACESHRLPLAQTWISCIQQGKKGNRHSEENFKACISTVDAACYVQDPCMMAFQQACSEHHLLRGQGIAGKAFMTNQPCFSSDITNFIKTEYPLSHHAKLFNLRAAVAIRLRCIHTGEVDFVLEFFLPVHCIDFEEQKLILNSLSITIQQVCQTLRIVTIRELKDETKLEIPSTNFSDKPVSEIGHSFPVTDKDLTVKAPAVGSTVKVSSWDGKMASLQNLSKNIPQSTLMGHTKQEFDGFSFSAHWDPTDADVHTENVFPEFKQHHGDSNNDHTVSSSTETMKRAAEKRRTKSEKTVSLQELQKYFAGSLKDAARSLGVCPTTLKRICRQHGITRWPSRKIKKVGHSLRKLQVVIDSVHGGAGAFQFSSLYENFIKTTCSDNNLATDAACALVNNIDHPDSSNVNQQLEGRFSLHTSGSHSLSSSSCSQNSNSSHGCSSEQKQCTNPNDFASGQATSVDKKLSRLLEKVENGVELYSLTEEEPKSVVRLRPEGQNLQTDHHFLGKMSPLPMNRSDFHKIKANFGEEKVILRLHPAWRFQDLKQEIRRRFNIADTTLVDIKYMDDDSEWVLITCDEDLMECIEVCKSTNAHSIKLSVFPVVQPTTRSSLASTALS